MNSIACNYLTALSLAASVISIAAQVETTTFSLRPRRTGAQFPPCTTKQGGVGKCVDWSYCNDDQEIETGGIIDDSELRSQECIANTWCCSEKNVTKPPPPKPKGPDTSNNCIVSEKPTCPWCVKLYRDGKDRRRLRSGFFCMGTLISTRVILTTATCWLQAKSHNLWARIPNSANPNTNYTVNYKLPHPQYNSGTRENDLALLTLETELEWDQSGPKGACIGLEPNSLVGECIAAGIDDDENIDMTPVIVAKGNCGSGADSDASCGHAVGGDCTIVPGSPIMCRPNKGPFTMTGLAKLPCSEDPPKALLNNLVQAKSWLNDHLKGTMKLTEAEYLKLSQ